MYYVVLYSIRGCELDQLETLLVHTHYRSSLLVYDMFKTGAVMNNALGIQGSKRAIGAYIHTRTLLYVQPA